MLLVVESACQFAPDRSKGVVVIESDCSGPPFTAAFTELDSAEARRLAIVYAQSAGVVPPRINGNVIGPYPVNSEGMSFENIHDEQGQPLPAGHPRMQPKRYRIDVPVCASLM
jgi:hypothetical protein